MKVLHLISTSVFSGAENVACQIINSFKEDNEEMYYTCVLGKNEEVLKEKEIKYIELKKFDLPNIYKVVKEYKPDIIHAHDIRASFYASFFHKNVKVISHVHNNHEDMRKFGIKTILFNFVSKRFSKIIWVSKSALDSYYYKKNVLNKSLVLYNAIDVNEIAEKVRKDKKNYNYDVVYLGRLTYQKNPERLIEIAKLVKEVNPNFKMAIIGDGELKDKIIEMINENKLNKNVKLLGFMNNPYKVLKQSKIAILTSRFEGTPMVALESMSLGVPMVSTYTDGMVDIIENGKNGYLCETNVEFAEIINDVITNDKKIEMMKKTTISISNKINDMKNYKKVLNKIYEGE